MDLVDVEVTGRSRIPHGKGANPRGGGVATYYFAIFPKNCMKFSIFGLCAGGPPKSANGSGWKGIPLVSVTNVRYDQQTLSSNVKWWRVHALLFKDVSYTFHHSQSFCVDTELFIAGTPDTIFSFFLILSAELWNRRPHYGFITVFCAQALARSTTHTKKGTISSFLGDTALWNQYEIDYSCK